VTFPSFEAARAGYGNLWRSMTIRREKRAALETAARKILRGKSRYMTVERATGVPWFVIGVLHYRESDCSFSTHLHNGDPLSGRTYHVPAGRPPAGNPPFTWEESAKDALSYEGFASIHDWPIERIGYSCEKYNGGGYYGQDLNSPYVWAGSNHYGTRPNVGKYTADGHFDPGAVDQQLGCMALIAVMMEMDSSISLWLGGNHIPPPPDVEPTTKKPAPKPPAKPGPRPKPPVPPASIVAGGGAAAVATYFGAHPAIILAAFIAAFVAFAIMMSKQK
jgi:lysozyme family protein